METKAKPFQQLLTDTLIAAEQQRVIGTNSAAKKERWFSAPDFFKNWFREQGSTFYFLFRKNLKVTNIQFAELLSLIRAFNWSNETNETIHDLQFLSVDEFNAALIELVNSFSKEKNSKHRYSMISKMYYSILSRHIIVEPFFGSCAVFVPPNLRIDLSRICAHSGYIHSCGTNIFTRKIDKATKPAFFGAIKRHLKKDPHAAPPFFVIYAHEDFTKAEKPEKKEYLRDGLDDVKIFLEKFYMNSERLIDVAEDMRLKFKGKLLFHDNGQTPSAAIRKAIEDKKAFDHTRTLWLLVDHSVGNEIQNKGRDLFYICYEQLYVNENPYQFFDENKPAWLTSTTIPHTLLAAMINIAGVGDVRKTQTVLADPFSGTGTTWLETIKFNNVVTLCTDRSPIARLLAEDNLKFFSMDFEQLRAVQDELVRLERFLREPPPPSPKDYPSAELDIVKQYLDAITLYDQFVEKKTKKLPRMAPPYAQALEISDNVKKLENAEFKTRLFFYLVLRTVGRSHIAISRQSEPWNLACAAQAVYLARQIGLLIDARQRQQESTSQRIGKFSIYNSMYSLACSISLDKIRDFQKQLSEDDKVSLRDVGMFDVTHDENEPNSSLKPQSCDVIITDPPYGFNTDDDLELLAKLYAEVIRKMINALKADGQLIICLLDRSHTGRRSPFFTHKELVTQQVLSLAESSVPKREVIIPAYAVPEMRELFRPPYYWESERALRRAILHFRIRSVDH